MFRKNNQQGRVPLKRRYLVLILAAIVLLAVASGTLAWMQYSRTLQTLTLVQVTDLTIVGPNENTLAMNLGDIDVSKDGAQEYVFGVQSNNVDRYWIQLAHTTNIPFTYTIYQATKNGTSFQRGDALDGSYKNPDGSIALAAGDYHDATYQESDGTSYDQVQKNAEPLYWQSSSDGIAITKGETQYFILEISWTARANDKETDMVYLTVGTSGQGTAGGGV